SRDSPYSIRTQPSRWIGSAIPQPGRQPIRTGRSGSLISQPRHPGTSGGTWNVSSVPTSRMNETRGPRKARLVSEFLAEFDGLSASAKQSKELNAAGLKLLALACGASVDQAARQRGLSSRTVHRLLAAADFRRRLQTLRSDMVSRTAGTLTAAATEAV